MEWGSVLVVACVLAALMLPFIGLYARRRWLTGQGGLFDCALRSSAGVPGSGWVLGFARYSGEELQWFRAMSLSWRPAQRFQRELTAYEHQRPASGLEAVVLFDDSRIVTLRDRATGREQSLAMDRDSVMGLMSWLESAPPGSHYVPGADSAG